ncbi:hypothetical protein C4573_05585 [Candidatus Woesearchaeota archaeon]|nr:MAG: hypothetical protein C4573_05585 [Candidatus Woesearchaeota archaeon]
MDMQAIVKQVQEGKYSRIDNVNLDNLVALAVWIDSPQDQSHKRWHGWPYQEVTTKAVVTDIAFQPIGDNTYRITGIKNAEIVQSQWHPGFFGERILGLWEEIYGKKPEWTVKGMKPEPFSMEMPRERIVIPIYR